VLPEDAEAGAKVLSALASGRSSDKLALPKARDLMARTAKQRKAATGGRCWRALQAELLGKTSPAVRDPYDVDASFKPGLNETNAFRRRWYTPERSALVVAGDMDLPHAIQIAERSFGDWKSKKTGAPVPTPKPNKLAPARVVIVDDPTATQVVLCAGDVVERSNRDSWQDVTIANILIGGDGGSRLNKRLRYERSLTYSIRSMLAAGSSADIGWILAAINKDGAGMAVSEVLDVLAGFASKPPSEEELHAAQGLALLQLSARYDGAAAALSALMKNFGLSVPLELDQKTAKLIPSTTPQAALEAAKHVFAAEHLVFVLIGPSKMIQEQLKQAGVGLPVEVRP
jgi:zinc protease